MKPYSKDLRVRVLAAVDTGRPREGVAETFSVSIPSIKRWLKRRRETGDVSPKPIPSICTPVKKAALKEWLPQHLRENPDLTLEEHCEAFEERTATKVSDATMSRAIAALPGEWPLKKVPGSPGTRRGGEGPVAMASLPLRREALGVRGRVRDAHRRESRLYSRAPKGERAYGRVPRNRGKNTTFIASITLEGAMGEKSVAIEGATDAEVLEAYVEHFLAPMLSEGQVVVLDGLGAHSTRRVRELVEARGAFLLFLPAYSPDLNPIEEAFSKVEARLRQEKARTKEALWWRRSGVRSSRSRPRRRKDGVPIAAMRCEELP